MKDRQKKMLRFLLNAENNIRIDDMAAAFNIGSRTVSRDLDYLEKWLSSRGVSLERKTNKGIRILTNGKKPDDILDVINTPESYFTDLPSGQRQKFIFLYLLFNSREIKIAEIAHTFFVSDTCVWNDLQQLEPLIKESGLSLLRQKGVGIQIVGDEVSNRLSFLRTFSRVFSTKSVIPYLYCVKKNRISGLEVNKLNLLLDNLKITGDHDFIFNLITLAEEFFDGKLTLSNESFIYFYLLITVRRIQSGFMINNAFDCVCLEHYRDAASIVFKMLTDKLMCGDIPPGEIELLGLLFQVSELGDINPEKYDRIAPLISKEISILSQKILSLAGEQDSEFFYLDPDLEKIMNSALASLLLREKNRIPHWYNEWGPLPDPDQPEAELEMAVAGLLKEEMNIEPDRKDIRSLLFHLKAAAINPRQFLKDKIRCLICCFEGIGLVSYLYSIISRDIPNLDIVEATAVYKFNQDYLDMNRIDLVISTFQIPDITTPSIVVPLPVDRPLMETIINEKIRTIKKNERRHIKLPEIAEKEYSGISIHSVLDFIQEFKVSSWTEKYSLKGIIRKAALDSSSDKSGFRKNEKALWKREALGELVLPEFGIRILHCKSPGVTTAKGGLINLDEDLHKDIEEKLLIYIIAPDPCPENIRLMLSSFTVAVMERPVLRKVLNSSDEEKVRLGLFDLYHSIL